MPNPSRHEILVVDDDEAVRDSLSLVLKSAGYDITTAINGFDALLQLKRRLPTIVLSDLNGERSSPDGFRSGAFWLVVKDDAQE
jgi:CheY-like chemotaxis protein